VPASQDPITQARAFGTGGRSGPDTIIGAKRAFDFTWLAASKQLCSSSLPVGFGWRSSQACDHRKRHANASNQRKCPAIDAFRTPGLPTPAHLTTVCTSLIRPRTEAIESQTAQGKKILFLDKCGLGTKIQSFFDFKKCKFLYITLLNLLLLFYLN